MFPSVYPIENNYILQGGKDKVYRKDQDKDRGDLIREDQENHT